MQGVRSRLTEATAYDPRLSKPIRLKNVDNFGVVPFIVNFGLDISGTSVIVKG